MKETPEEIPAPSTPIVERLGRDQLARMAELLRAGYRPRKFNEFMPSQVWRTTLSGDEDGRPTEECFEFKSPIPVMFSSEPELHSSAALLRDIELLLDLKDGG